MVLGNLGEFLPNNQPISRSCEQELITLVCNTNKLLAAIVSIIRSRGTGLLTAAKCDDVLRNAFSGQEHRLSSWSTGTTVIELMKEDPQRTGFIVANGSTGTFGISLTSAMAFGNSIRIDGQERTYELWQPLAGSLVQHKWFGVSDAGGAFGILIEHFCGKFGPPGDGVNVVLCP